MGVSATCADTVLRIRGTILIAGFPKEKPILVVRLVSDMRPCVFWSRLNAYRRRLATPPEREPRSLGIGRTVAVRAPKSPDPLTEAGSRDLA